MRIRSMGWGAAIAALFLPLLLTQPAHADTAENERYVRQLFADVLGQEDPDPAEVIAWVEALDGGAARADVTSALVGSDEYRTLTVRRFYLDLLGRSADQGGLDFWTGQLAGGVTQEVLAASIIASDEYFAVAGTNEGFVTRTYQDLLGRDPDPAGLTYWTGRLDAGDPRFSLTMALLFTDEALAARVDGQYNLYLRRDADDGGRDFWVEFLRGGGRIEDLAVLLTASDEYFELAQEQQAHGPVAVDDNAVTDPDTPVSVDVLANDTDPDGDIDPGSVIVTAPPVHGTTTVDTGTGAVVYTPVSGFSGDDAFMYRVCDASSLCDSATAHITVNPPANSQVNARADAAATDVATPVTIDVLANDHDAGGTLDPGSVSITEDPKRGAATVNPTDGSVTYTPEPDVTGEDSFRYRVCDLGAPTVCDEADVVVVISHAPDAVDDTATTPANQSVAVPVLANDTDEDGDIDGTTLAVVERPASGLTTVDTNVGSIVYTPNTGFVGTDTFTYQICDATGLCDEASVTVTVGS